MLWNLPIDHSNLKELLIHQKDKIQRDQIRQQEFAMMIDKVQDPVLKDILQHDQNIDENLQELVALCLKLQNYHRQILSSEFDLKCLNEYIQFIKCTNYDDEKVDEYFQRLQTEIKQYLKSKYEASINDSLQPIIKKDIDVDFINLEDLSQQIICLRQIDANFLSQLFNSINTKIHYHFIDLEQVSSSIDKSDWLCRYLLQQVEELIYAPESIIQAYAEAFIDHVVIKNLKLRLHRDSEEFIKHANQALKFVEDVFQLNKSLEIIWSNNFNSKINIIQDIHQLNKSLGIYDGIQKLEQQLIQTNLFEDYDAKFQDVNVNYQMVLNFIEDFTILWNSLSAKYQNEHQNSFDIIFQQFSKKLTEYFKIITTLPDKKQDFLKYLQTFYIGIKSLKTDFPQYKSDIKTLQSIIDRHINPLVNSICELFYKSLFLQYIWSDDSYAFYKQIDKITLYVNNRLYFLQSQIPYAVKLNNYSVYATQICNKIIEEQLYNHQYNLELTQLVIRSTIKQLHKKIIEQSYKVKFNALGKEIFNNLVLRTTILILADCAKLECTKYLKLVDDLNINQ